MGGKNAKIDATTLEAASLVSSDKPANVADKTLSKNNYRKTKIHVAKFDEKRQSVPRYGRALKRVHFPGKVIVIDDEKYFTLSNSEIKGYDGFYKDNVQNILDNVKFKSKYKFEDKILVRCAISNNGVLQPYVERVHGEAINADICIGRSLTKLRNFIVFHQRNDQIILWPDFTSSHYARRTTDWLAANAIIFVPKVVNPPNVPQARPIKDF
ncbi:unnamed protein product [Psylliodes chrysocephalus]|uniref:Transposase n=1 Tax=Psylliodes chrysocephalus TaxID=3402493 RepID=A0A9P0D122_9CUCU|nr:unnamed protein product [Psylliodes chrysocephala]